MSSMAYVFPVLVVGANQDLIVQPIRRHRHGRHVGRKLKQRRQAIHTNKAKPGGQRRQWLIIARTSRDDEAPLAKRWNVDVIWISAESGLLQRFRNTPI